MKFYIVDAFADVLFGGNPAGVVLLDKGTDFPEDEIMRKTAAELRYSETAFVKPIDEREFNIRYFTPAAEVDICGHATIGAFYALLNEGMVTPGECYVSQTLAGRLTIEVGSDVVYMDMSEPKDLGALTDPDSVKALYEIMGLSYKGQGLLQGYAAELEPRLVSTGLPDIMLPVRDEEELKAIEPDYKALAEFSEKLNIVGVHAFTLNTEDGYPHCRNFAPLYQINEEAATGTANGALTFYLYRHQLISEGKENRFIQGEKMGRPSTILSRLTASGNAIKVQIGGRAVILAEGTIAIS